MVDFFDKSGIEYFFIYHEPFMLPFRDQIHLVMSLYREYKFSSIDIDQFNNRRHLKTRWGCSFVTYINVSSHCLFFWPIKMRVNRFNTSPLKEANQKPGSKDFWHCNELL